MPTKGPIYRWDVEPLLVLLDLLSGQACRLCSGLGREGFRVGPFGVLWLLVIPACLCLAVRLVALLLRTAAHPGRSVVLGEGGSGSGLSRPRPLVVSGGDS